MKLLLCWLTFTACCLFMVVVRAAMSAHSEHSPFKTARAYFADKPLTLSLQLIIAQLMFFGIWDNPRIVGDLFGKLTGKGTFTLPTRWWLAGFLGLASNWLSDLLIVAGSVANSWATKKVRKAFNEDGAATAEGDK